MTKHNKHYYEEDRNGWTPTKTWQDEVIEDKDDKWGNGSIKEDEEPIVEHDGMRYNPKTLETLGQDEPKAKESNINPKMFLTKEEIEFMKKTKYNFNWQLDKTVERIVKLLKEKNKSYGNTALNPANIFSSLDSVEAICARIDDKLSRIKNRGINDKTEDTVDDLIGYLLLLKMSMEK